MLVLALDHVLGRRHASVLQINELLVILQLLLASVQILQVSRVLQIRTRHVRAASLNVVVRVPVALVVALTSIVLVARARLAFVLSVIAVVPVVILVRDSSHGADSALAIDDGDARDLVLLIVLVLVAALDQLLLCFLQT